MQTVGDLLTIIGILLTLASYYVQHSGVSLADLEPGLTARWNRTRAWVRRRLGLTKTITRQVPTALDGSAALSVTGIAWSRIQPGDDIAVRADKLERNLDRLRANLDEHRKQDQQRFREVTDRLTERVNELDQLVATRHEEIRRATTAAMRWEVRGLLITLVGAGLSILG